MKNTIHLMGVGDSGGGKTGSLVEVCNNMDSLGFSKIVIQDWDDGLDVLKANVKPEVADRVYFETLRDEMKGAVPSKQEIGGPIVRGEPTAWVTGMTLLNNWKVQATKDAEGNEVYPAYDLGPANSWGPDTLFVTDTLTGMGDAAFNYVKHVDKRLDDWRAVGKAMGLQSVYAQMVVTLKCNVIVFAHIRYMGGGGKVAVEDKDHPGILQYKEVDSNVDGQGYPSALGRQLPTQIMRHFNFGLEWKLSGKKRKIRTVPEDRLVLKCPVKLPDEMDQVDGLYRLFKAVKEMK
jgi:hypothetical protein